MGQPRVSRAEAGLRPPKSAPQGIATRSATAHWEGPHMGAFSHDKCAGTWRSIQNYHMDNMGWNDIAYNFGVCPHGYIYTGRDHGIRSAANGNNEGNNTSEAMCYISGEGDPFTTEGQTALAEIMRETSAEHHCHNDWFNTACPGVVICDWVRAGMPGIPTAPAGPTSPTKFGPFPLPADHWFGPTSPDYHNHSGFYHSAERPPIMQIQDCLGKYCGHPLTVDGYYGNLTATAVRDFQAFFQLGVDGLTGPQTWGMLGYIWDSNN